MIGFGVALFLLCIVVFGSFEKVLAFFDKRLYLIEKPFWVILLVILLLFLCILGIAQLLS